MATNKPSEFSTVFCPNHWSQTPLIEYPNGPLTDNVAELAGLWIAICSGLAVLLYFIHPVLSGYDPRARRSSAKDNQRRRARIFFSSVTHYRLLCISAHLVFHIYLILRSIEAFSVVTRSGNCPSGEYVFGKTPATQRHYRVPSCVSQKVLFGELKPNCMP